MMTALVVLVLGVGVAGQEPPRGAASTAGDAREAPREPWATREDVLLVAQVFAAAAGGAVAGAVALVPASAAMTAVSLAAWMNGAPAVALAVGAGGAAAVILVTALAGGAAAWGVSLASPRYRVRAVLPVASRAVTSLFHGSGLPGPVVSVLEGLAGLAFAHGAAGYAVGAALGVVLAVMAAMPGMGMAWFLGHSQAGAVPGFLALAAASVLAVGMLVVFPAVLGPAFAVTAAQVAKVPLEPSVPE